MVDDRQILEMGEAAFFRTVQDLHKLLPKNLPKKFDTGELAKAMKVPRSQAQRIAYVMRKTGALVEVEKRGNAIVCRKANKTESKKALIAKRPKKKAKPPKRKSA